MDEITSIAELEACIGVAGLPVKMKIIDHADEGARRWIAAAPIAFVGVAGRQGLGVLAASGVPGFVTTAEREIILPVAALDGQPDFTDGAGASLLFLVPGIGETLRINGALRHDGANLRLAVNECFLHCAKALIRSGFWNATPADDAAPLTLDDARFLVIATADSAGRVDLSPKGDPAGLLIRHENGTAMLAERPGNRLAFGYRNIINNAAIAGLAIVPGRTQLVAFTGRAALSTAEGIRAPFTVDGKMPILATIVRDLKVEAQPSPALTRAALWPNTVEPTIDPSAVLVGHVKLNKTRGLQAIAIRTAANRSLVAKGLDHAYKHSLY